MKLRHPVLLRWCGFLVAVLARLLHATIRHREHCVDGSRQPNDPKEQRLIYATFHESILTILYTRTPIDILISQHADGELITQACRFLNYGAIRGSSTRGGAAAVRHILGHGAKRHLLITPDGPRGPRRAVGFGLVYLASRTGLPIRLVAFGYSRTSRLRTWDRLAMPWPWSTTYRLVSEEIHVPEGLNRDEMTDYCGRIQRRFIQLIKSAERWAETGRRPGQAELQPADDSFPTPTRV